MKKTRLIGMKPVDAIKQTLIKKRFSQPVKDFKSLFIIGEFLVALSFNF